MTDSDTNTPEPTSATTPTSAPIDGERPQPKRRKRTVISCVECHRRKQKVRDARPLPDDQDRSHLHSCTLSSAPPNLATAQTLGRLLLLSSFCSVVLGIRTFVQGLRMQTNLAFHARCDPVRPWAAMRKLQIPWQGGRLPLRCSGANYEELAERTPRCRFNDGVSCRGVTEGCS